MTLGNSYTAAPAFAKLGPAFSDPVKPARFPKYHLRYRNSLWAENLGLGGLSDTDWIECFGKFSPLPGNLTEPLALRYHGHQFTHYNPDLGDGRGFLYAQLRDPDQRLLDFGTKGSGQTPYSRQGDGRLTLKGAIREALATHRLETLGVNTSKTFSIIETGENLERNDEPSPTRSAVLVRLNHSHIRFGSFQRLAYFKEAKNMQVLMDYCLSQLYPGVAPKDFFQEICRRVAQTTAEWMIHGFVHGVLNTDNINITGESFDYGPYRFLPSYDTKFTAAYFDHQGLYAYGRQPQMMLWNLERLEEALRLIEKSDAFYNKGYALFKKTFSEEVLRLFCKKIGILADLQDPDVQNFFYQCLQFLEKSKAPYSPFFQHLYLWHQNLDRPLTEYAPNHYDTPEVEEIETALAQMERDPKACEKTMDDFDDLLIDEIEAIWTEIDKNDNWAPFYKKISCANKN